jgi:predicted DCC family thiol-disulfide oxidoreductase YuxK
VKHLVFYDGACGFCDRVVQFLLCADTKKRFAFAPLQGKTALKYLESLPESMKGVDSLILIENYLSIQPKTFVLGKAAFRICWLLGGAWVLLGWTSFLPSFLYDWGYRLVARNRHRIFKNNVCQLPQPQNKERFLP